MVKLILGLAAGVLLIILLTVGLGNSHLFQNTSSSNGKFRIVGSFYPMAYFAGQLAGNTAEVTNITPANAEPHDYEPSTGDIAKIEHAQLLILNGQVESWGNKIKANLKGTKTDIVTAGDGLFTRDLTEGGKTDRDPHLWLDPVLAKQEMGVIAAALTRDNPGSADVYTANQQNLDRRLDQLDSQYRSGLAMCKKQDIVTSHAAFGYLAARYGLNQVPIAGLSPDEEPSSQQLAEVAKFVKQNNVTVIFFESLVSPKLSQAIATETGARTLELNPLEGLTDNDLKQGKDYFTIMKDNLRNLRTALECQ